MDRLNKNQQEALRLLLNTNLTNKEIGDRVGVRDRTIYRWKNDEVFDSIYREELLKKENMVRESLLKNVEKAHERVLNIITNSDSSDKDALNAAKWYLEQVLGKATNKHELDTHSTVDHSYSNHDILAIFDEQRGEDDE